MIGILALGGNQVSSCSDASVAPPQIRVTGVMVQYFVSCKRELWFFAHGVNMNFEDNNILIGRLLHETTYQREKKNILIDDTISIDFAKMQDQLVVFEIKKSRRLVEPAKYQLLYYLYYLKKMGITAQGKLVYPKQRKSENVVLTPELESEIERILSEIRQIVMDERPPPAERRPHCRGCSYFDFCWV